ncbi:MAG: hypothetical protein J5826_09485, partial [Bacteroidales bacterium]|nr:hypothetical protein [Bacteroidales bacterium]
MKTYPLLILFASAVLSASAQDEYIIRYYEKTEIKESEGQFKNGHPDGRWKYYTPSGKLNKE